MKTKLAIFDIDGTLVDSRAVITECMQEAFEQHGLSKPSYDVVRTIVGLSLETAIDKIAPRDISHDDLLVLVERYKTAFIQRREAKTLDEPLYTGAMDLLETLRADGWTMGVATGKSRRGLDAIIKTHGFDRFFDCHFCADDGPGKPHPSMIHANLNACGVLPQNAVMIGDTSFDMIMSKAAEVKAIGVTWGFHTSEEIAVGGADHLVDTLEELGAVLNQFSRLHAL